VHACVSLSVKWEFRSWRQGRGAAWAAPDRRASRTRGAGKSRNSLHYRKRHRKPPYSLAGGANCRRALGRDAQRRQTFGRRGGRQRVAMARPVPAQVQVSVHSKLTGHQARYPGQRPEEDHEQDYCIGMVAAGVGSWRAGLAKGDGMPAARRRTALPLQPHLTGGLGWRGRHTGSSRPSAGSTRSQ
jgi:hypothetical protein